MTSRSPRLLVAATVLALAGACAGRLPPVPASSSPRYPDFVYPSVPPSLTADTRTAERHERGWRFLQANDLRNAEREFSAAIKRNAGFFPSDAGLGYVSLAQKDYKAALARFEVALKQSGAYAPALVGRGDALLGLARPADALRTFQSATAADPGLAVAAERVQVLQLRTLGSEIASARRAADAGRYDEARRAYERAIAASPDSAFLYRDLATLERRQGDLDAALRAFQKAASMDPGDARSLVQIGEILEARGDYDGAVRAYAQASAIEPGDAVAAQLARARERAALKRLPAEFAQIATTPRLTRGDLAALLGVHFPAILETQRLRDTPVITDTRAHWASPWILAVARAGLMTVNPNHTFEPRNPVRRLDLARVVSRLLDLAATVQPSLAARWQSPQSPQIADVPVGHLDYAAVSQVVSAGAIPLDQGAFHPAQLVTGEEALQVIDRVEKLVGLPGRGAAHSLGARRR